MAAERIGKKDPVGWRDSKGIAVYGIARAKSTKRNTRYTQNIAVA